MSDRERLMARLRAAANEIAAELGSSAAMDALDTVKRELSDEMWRPRR
jgi:hypothetical protein